MPVQARPLGRKILMHLLLVLVVWAQLRFVRKQAY